MKRGIDFNSVRWVILAAALGYFVDMFDMWLFVNYRVASLKDLGVPSESITYFGIQLMNAQLAGFLLGGLCFGICGDKCGRMRFLVVSIFIYSTTTLLNAFVVTTTQYSILRFLSGFGLAGEIGLGITLVSEVLPPNLRGWGTTIVTACGVAGTVAAALVAKLIPWQSAYVMGGIMGYLLLALRVLTHESEIYIALCKKDNQPLGRLRDLLCAQANGWRVIWCVLIGAPLYLVWGLFVSFAPEISQEIGVQDEVRVADAMLLAALGFTLGDIIAGVASQILENRKLPMLLGLIGGALTVFCIVGGFPRTGSSYCAFVALASFFCGFWACLITLTAEQFGTNVRATATTLVPNLVRASAIVMTSSFVSLKSFGLSTVSSTFVVSFVTYSLAVFALSRIRESYGTDLRFLQYHSRDT